MMTATLTAQQRDVVRATSGHVVVLAGPGSGKTHTLTTKIAHLFRAEVVPEPYRIVALTFTNAAAREMRKRLRGWGFNEWDRVFVGTYHAFGQHLLRVFGREVGIAEDFDIDPQQATRIASNAAADFPRFDPDSIGRRIESCKRRGLLPRELPPPTDEDEEEFAALYRAYEEELRKAGLVDYADLILWPQRLLARRTEAYFRVKNAFRYVLADEFQDTDPQQLELVATLAEDSSSTVVADDDQSIYGWRGAVRANVEAIGKRLKAASLTLGTNFRSDAVLVEGARRVIAGDPGHHAKGLVAASTSLGAICVEVFDDINVEAQAVTQRIIQLAGCDIGVVQPEIAVISRARSRVEELLRVLTAAGVRWFDRDRLKFEDAWEAQLALAALSCLFAADAATPLHLLMSAIEDAGVDRAANEDALEMAMGVQRRLGGAQLHDGMVGVGDLHQVLETAHVTRWVRLVAASDSDEQRRMTNITLMLGELRKDAEETTSLRESVRRFLGLDAVQVATGHGSKGREFDAVFLVGLEDDSLPTYHSHGDADQLGEERRIFYVGLTRARRLAHLSSVRSMQNRYGRWFSKTPSRFLNALPGEMRSSWLACTERLAAT